MFRTFIAFLLAAPCAVAGVPTSLAANGFIENVGQFDARVAFQLQLADRDLFVARDAAIVHRFNASNDRNWILVERWSSAPGTWQGADAATAAISLIAPGGARHGGVHAQLRRASVWPGVDAELRWHDDIVESRFDVAAGVDPAIIRVALEGADALRLRNDGGLSIDTGIGALQLSAPIAWQMIDGERVAVAVSYALRDDGYGFFAGRHDAHHALHIDPVIRSTFVGGNSDEGVTEIAVADDSVYVAGYTQSANFPGTSGGFQPAIIRNSTLGGNAFVARYSRDLTQLLQATYFGSHNGAGLLVQQIAVNADSVYLAGSAPDGSLPVGQTPGAQSSAPSGAGAFVARLNRGLTQLRSTSYHGGSVVGKFTNANGIAVDANGVYIAGNTISPDLPGSAGSAVATMAGGSDAFIARFSLDLGTRLHSSYVTGVGSSAVDARDVLVDADGVYIAGESQGTGLLATGGAFQPNKPAGIQRDGFIARFSHDLTTLHRSTYLGGGHDERVWRLAANSTAIYAVGDVNAGSSNFPLAPNAPDSTFANWEGYVFAISRDLSTRIGATLIGGSNSDGVYAIVAEDTRVFVAGTTLSNNLPGTSGGAEAQNPDQQTVGFVTQFDPALSEIRQSSYYGVNTGSKYVAGLAVSGSDVYIAGNMPGGTLPNSAGSAQPLHGGGTQDGFIGLFSADLQPPQPVSDLAITKTGSADLEYNHFLIYTIEVRNLGPDAAVGARVQDLLPATIGTANWTCAASAGASCGTVGGAGSIDQFVDLPVGGLVTYTLCARHIGVGASALNTATVSVAAGRVDSNLGNNSDAHDVADPSLFKDGFEDALPPPLCVGL